MDKDNCKINCNICDSLESDKCLNFKNKHPEITKELFDNPFNVIGENDNLLKNEMVKDLEKVILQMDKIKKTIIKT